MNLFLVFIILPLIVTGQDQCCQPPISIFATSQDLANIFSGIDADLYLVRGGSVDGILQVDGIGLTLYVGSEVDNFPFLMVANINDVFIKLIFTSDDLNVVLTPVMVPYSEGIVPVETQRFHVLFECTGNNMNEVVITVTVNITSYNNVTGEVYCPLYFMFGKQCLLKNIITPQKEMEFDEIDYVSNVSIPQYVGCNRTTGSPPIDIDGNALVPILSSLIPLTIIIIITIIVILLCWITRYNMLKSQRAQLLQLDTVSKAYINTRDQWIPSRRPHEKEFPPDQLVLKREIGEGAFGTVYEGEAYDILYDGVVTPVAVKQLQNSNATNEFFREVSFMSRLKHDNVVSLLGVCGLSEPYAMIFEYMDCGDLCSFLRDALQLRDEQGTDVLTNEQLVYISYQIATGMEYIASTKLVHRDLAARNCLVATGLVIKIADFGLSRNIYSTDYYRVEGSTLLPIRWMPPESIQYGKFTEASDVYSFGVLLWEIFTFGEQPFAGHSNEEVVEMIIKGNHLVIPSNCPVHDVINDCWQWKPKERPNFKELQSHLKTLCHDLNIAI